MKNWIILTLFWLWQMISFFIFVFVGEWHDPEDGNGLMKGEDFMPTFGQHIIYYLQMFGYILISILILYLYGKKIIAQKKDWGGLILLCFVLVLGILGQIAYALVVVRWY
ncbi:MAG: hypothetical protein Q4B43_10645 [Bacteroidota bacterium]|nr:hypothetical protein [Bacteroidota bacterium]